MRRLAVTIVIAVSVSLGCGGSSFEVANADDASQADTTIGGTDASALDSSVVEAAVDSSIIDTGTKADSTTNVDTGSKSDTGTKPDTATVDSFIADTAPLDAADKCAGKTCTGEFMECCALTGACYDTRCLSCCMTFATPP